MKKTYLIIISLFFLTVFHAWFLNGNVSGFDHPYFFTEYLKELPALPSAWDSVAGNGFGENKVPLFWVDSYLLTVITIFANLLHLPWEIVQRIGWFFPYILLSISVPYYFLKSLKFKFNNVFIFIIGTLIFSANTYILMIIAGGQMNIALAYALSPLVLLQFMNSSKQFNSPRLHLLKKSCISGLLFALLIMLDLRLALLILIAAIIYFMSNIIYKSIAKTKKSEILFLVKQNIIWIFGLPLVIALLLHIYWILPLIISHQTQIEENSAVYTSNAVSFFSFARLENTIALLHPNWPENIFGKVSFMKPEFLLLPVFAYLSLIFIKKEEKNKEKNQIILFFALLGLVGAFLAKGTNDPFGNIYSWAYLHIPGFSLFRDPTKFYIYVAISYLVLIPIGILSVYELLKQKTIHKLKIANIQIQKRIPQIFLILTLSYLLFLIRPALLGKLDGTLETNVIPGDYFKLQKILAEDNSFSRILWVPQRQRYGFYNNIHPAVNAQDLFNLYTQHNLLKKLTDKKTERALQNASIKYVIIPVDSEKEIFLKDNMYSDKEYKSFIESLKKIRWLKQLKNFNSLSVFEIPDAKGLFWASSRQYINYKFVNSTTYFLNLKNIKEGERIIFTQKYDSGWVAEIKGGKEKINSEEYDKNYNSFILPKKGSYSIEIEYMPQRIVDIGEWLRFTTLLIVILILIYPRIKK